MFFDAITANGLRFWWIQALARSWDIKSLIAGMSASNLETQGTGLFVTNARANSGSLFSGVPGSAEMGRPRLPIQPILPSGVARSFASPQGALQCGPVKSLCQARKFVCRPWSVLASAEL
tara:strand:- start:15 stop:374 length:360 start_codon:yes stop_codon:yes gene_type:complete